MRAVLTFAAFAIAAGIAVPKYAAQMHAGAAGADRDGGARRSARVFERRGFALRRHLART